MSFAFEKQAALCRSCFSLKKKGRKIVFKNEKLRWMMGWPLGPKINKLHLSTLLYIE
jgi:hypothetical protein